MLRVANRVKESTLTSGSGTIALAGASNGYQSFSSVLSNGDTSYYTIVNGDSWEVGIGTYSSSTLSRDVVLSSSNSNNKLDLNGQSYVFIAYPSEKSVYKDQNDQVVVGSSGVIIGSGNPFITSNVLYNSGGILYFNGLPVSSSVSITGVSGIGVSQNGNSYTISATGSFGLTSGQIQQLLNSGVSINVLSGTGNFNVLSVTGTPVSLSGHVHSISDIINFNTEVSGLIPVKDILSGSGIQIGVTSGVYTVTAYGVAASSASSLITRCENRTGSALPKMTVVYINGGQGNRPTIQKSIASSEGGSSKTYGVTASQINDNSAGDVVVFGALIDVDTNQFGAVEGSTLYLSPSVSGNLTATKPTAPNHMVAVGKIVRNHNTQGIIEVSIQNGFELEELHNVATTGAASGQFLKYDGGLWRNTGILSSDISDFSSAVSGLLPSISGSGYARVLLSNNIYTVSVTGLQPSGNYSISGHQHTSSDIINFNSSVSGLLAPYALLNSGNFTTLLVTNVPVSLSGHLHTSSQITDFNSSVSSLIPVKNVVGSGYVNVVSTTGLFAVSVTGLQPSGNYSLSGHTHIASNITDFNSATSGLLTPYAQLDDARFNNLAVNTLFTSDAPNFSVSEDGNTSIGGGSQLVEVLAPNVIIQYSLSAASGTISSGLNVFNYLRLNNTGVSLSGHSHTVSDISNFGSGVSGLLPVRDIIAGTGIAISNISGVFTINSSGSTGGGSSNVAISNSGVGRLLASDGTSSGIIGQSNLTFINNNLAVNGVIINNGNNLYMWSNFR